MKKDIIKNHIRGELAQEISQILLQRIEAGFYPPGGKIDSIRQIASSLGVSTVSVQNAVSVYDNFEDTFGVTIDEDERAYLDEKYRST